MRLGLGRSARPAGLLWLVVLVWWGAALAGAAEKKDQPLLVLDPGGHVAQLRAIAFSPDGKLLYSAGEDKVVQVWDVAGGQPVRQIRGERGAGTLGKIYALALSPDGQTLAVGGWLDPKVDYIRLHEAATGKVLGLLQGHSDVVLALAFSPDGKLLASTQGGKEPQAIIWDLATRRPLKSLKGHTAQIYAVAWSPDGQRLVTGGFDNQVILWDAASGRKAATMAGHTDKVRAVAFDPTGKYVATASYDKTVRLWDGRTGQAIKVLAQMGARAASLGFSPDGRKVVVGPGAEGPAECRIVSVPEGHPVAVMAEHKHMVLAAAFSPDGKVAATAGGVDQEILLWDAATGQVRKKLAGVGGAVYAVGFSQDGTKIAWGFSAGPCKYDCPDPNMRGPLQFALSLRQGQEWNLAPAGRVEDQAVYRRAAAQQGGLTLTPEKGGKFGVHHALKLTRQGQPPTQAIRDQASGYGHFAYTLTPDGQFVASGGGNGVLALLKVPEMTKVADFIGHEDDVWAVACSTDGRYLLSGANDQTVRIWDLQAAAKGGSVEPLASLFVGKDGVQWLAWTPQGHFAGAEGAARFVGYQINRGVAETPEFVRSDQLTQGYFRPELVAARIGFQPTGELEGVTQMLAGGLPPEVKIVSPQDGAAVGEGPVKVSYQVVDKGQGVGTVVVKLNGVAVGAAGGRSIRRQKEEVAPGQTREVQVNLVGGQDNVVEISAYEAQERIRGRAASLRLTSRAKAGQARLLALAAGVNTFAEPKLNLSFARPDAEAVAKLLTSPSVKALYAETQVKLLTDQEVTPASLRQALDQLKTQAKPEDLVIIYLASHGTVQGQDYFILTSATNSFNPTDLPKNSLTGVELQEALTAIPAGKKLLILDACESGELVTTVHERLSANTKMKLVADFVGLKVFSASTSQQKALEGVEGHGLFTYVVLKGLAGEADMYQSGLVDTVNLEAYVAAKVPALAQSKWGAAQTPVATGLGKKFDLAKTR